jgi:hypothetical protein
VRTKRDFMKKQCWNRSHSDKKDEHIEHVGEDFMIKQRKNRRFEKAEYTANSVKFIVDNNMNNNSLKNYEHLFNNGKISVDNKCRNQIYKRN